MEDLRKRELEVKSSIVKNDLYLKYRFDQEKSKYDGANGKCCCCLQNKRGVRLILYFDMIWFLLPYRAFPAFSVLYINYNKSFKCYSNMRVVSFWLQLVLMAAGYLTWITLEVLGTNSSVLEILIVGLVIVFISLIDWEFTKAVKYHSTNLPVKKAPIQWLSSDSELGFQY